MWLGIVIVRLALPNMRRNSRSRNKHMIDIAATNCTAMLESLSANSADLIHADPPWAYDNTGTRGNAADQYEGLNNKEIAAHVEAAYRVAKQGSYLVVWCTFPKLQEWLTTPLNDWQYITGGAWGKTNGLGVGFHFRGDAELLLLYKKGKPKPLITTSNLWLAPRIGHSEKPQTALRALVKMAVPQSGLVVDLYAGASASMARACRALGRRYIGAEIDSQRQQEAIRRLHQQEMDLVSMEAA